MSNTMNDYKNVPQLLDGLFDLGCHKNSRYADILSFF
jgi:hypothetical protein